MSVRSRSAASGERRSSAQTSRLKIAINDIGVVDDSRRAPARGEHGNLAEDVPRPERSKDFTVAGNVGGAVFDRKERMPEIPFGGDLAAGLDVEL
jgi:hypothetical protein